MKEIYSKESELLASEILYHKKLYYKGKAIISDEAFDALEERLREINPYHPVLSLVGYDLDSSRGKVEHILPMLSLAKTYEVKDLFDFVRKYDCVVTDKVDGMALCLEYDAKGHFFRASTRGNGLYGEDVTEHIFHVPSIPKVIKNSLHYPLEIRGELYFPNSAFEGFRDRFESFRNAVPGTLGRKDVEDSLDILKSFQFYVYDFIASSPSHGPLSLDDFYEKIKKEKKYTDKLVYLKSLGFDNKDENPLYILKVTSHDDLNQRLNDLFHKKRNYQIDGLVFRVNDERLWNALGSTSHHPRGSLAFKQHGESVETKILDIETNIGRTGKKSFRARLEPVEISGAKISYATLHNAEFIEKGGYAPGAVVEVKRSGEVIPYIVRLVKAPKDSYVLPKLCACGYPLTRQNADLYCFQKTDCKVKKAEEFIHFVSSIGVKGVSEKIVRKLIDSALVKKLSDFFKLKKEEVITLEGFKEKSAKNLVLAFEENKTIPLAKFLFALNLKRGGEVKCEELSEKFKTLEKIQALNEEDLIALDGWASKSAKDFLDSLKDKRSVIEDLLTVVSLEEGEDIAKESSHPYFAKSFCMTGTLSLPRDEYKKRLHAVGGKLVSTVTKNTDFLVCNEASTSSKYRDALKLGTQIINEDTLMKGLSRAST